MTDKKSTPGGAPISEQDHGTTPKGKSHAMFARIRTGKENASDMPVLRAFGESEGTFTERQALWQRNTSQLPNTST